MKSARKITPLLIALVLAIYPAWLGIEYLEMQTATDNRLAIISNDAIAIYHANNFEIITPPNVRVHRLAWSPDGQKIAFIYEKAPFDFAAKPIVKMFSIGQVDVHTQNVEHLFSFQNGKDGAYWYDRGLDLAWSPDGRKILFSMIPNITETRLYLLDVETKTLQTTQIALAGGPDEVFCFISWNPGAFPLISVSRKNNDKTDHNRIYRINDDFSIMTYVTDGGNATWWGANQKMIVFNRWPNPDREGDLYASSFDGTDIRLIARQKLNSAWSPDGRFMADTYVVEGSMPLKIVMYDAQWNRTFDFNRKSINVGRMAWSSK